MVPFVIECKTQFHESQMISSSDEQNNNNMTSFKIQASFFY